MQFSIRLERGYNRKQCDMSGVKVSKTRQRNSKHYILVNLISIRDSKDIRIVTHVLQCISMWYQKKESSLIYIYIIVYLLFLLN